MIKNKAILFFLLIIGMSVSHLAMAIEEDEINNPIITDVLLPVNYHEFDYDEHVIFGGIYQLPADRVLSLQYLIAGVPLHTQEVSNCTVTPQVDVPYSWDAGSVIDAADGEPFVYQTSSADLQLAQISLALKECSTGINVGTQVYKVADIKIGFEPKPYLHVSHLGIVPAVPAPVTVIQGEDPQFIDLIVKNAGPVGTVLVGEGTLFLKTEYFSICSSPAFDPDCNSTINEVIYNLISGETMEVRVKFFPDVNTATALGTPFSDFMTFTCDSLAPSCGGGVLEEIVGFNGNSTLPGPPSVNVVDALSVSLSSINFYPPYVEVNSPGPAGEATMSVWIENTGGSDLYGSVDDSSSDNFECESGCQYNINPIAPGDKQEAVIKFDPNDGGVTNYSETISFTAKDSLAVSYTPKVLIVKGTGILEPIIKVLADYSVVSPPPEFVYPGTYYAGDVETHTITISNIGGFKMSGDIFFETNDPSNITCIGCGSFDNIEYGGTPYQFAVKFDPQTSGPKYATSTIVSDHGEPDVVTVYTMLLVEDLPILQVTSAYDNTEPVSDWDIPGPVNLGDVFTTEFYIKNIGAKTLTGTISVLDVVGDAGQFKCVNQCDYMLDRSESRTAYFEFVPSGGNGASFPRATATFPNNEDTSQNIEVDMFSAIVNTSASGALSHSILTFGNVLRGFFFLEFQRLFTVKIRWL